MALAEDPRWRRFQETGWVCSNCQERHKGIFDLGCANPDYWSDGTEPGPNSLVGTSSHFLSEDFCVLNNEHFFVRCVLEIPVIGSNGASFGFGVWSSLSRDNFSLYVDGFDGGTYGAAGPWFGWFSNTLKGYPDTLGLKCQVYPRDGRDRPYIELEPIDHPLVTEQQSGISLDRLLEIYALNGHKLRSTLS